MTDRSGTAAFAPVAWPGSTPLPDIRLPLAAVEPARGAYRASTPGGVPPAAVGPASPGSR